MRWPSFSKSAQTPPVEKKSYTPIDIEAGSIAYYALSGENIGPQAAFRMYQSSSAVGTAVDMIGDSIKQITPVVMIDGEIFTEHEILDFLMKPNDFQTWGTFSERLAKNFLITGNTDFTAVGNINRPPLEVYSVKATLVSPQQAVDLYPRSFNVATGVGRGNYLRNTIETRNTARFLDGGLKEFWRIMAYNSEATELAGDSLLRAIALDVKQQIKGRVHNLSVLDRGGRLSMVATFKDTMTAEQHTERRELIADQLSGADNAGKIAVLSSADMSLEEFGVTNKDMDYAELDRVSSLAVFMRYKIPLPLVTVTASTFNNYTTAIEALYDFAVLPTLDFLLSGLTRAIVPRFGHDPAKVKITYDPDGITALMDRRLKQLKERKEIGVETVDELRSLLPNRAEVEGGDVVLIKAAEVPLSDAGKIFAAKREPTTKKKESESPVY